MALHWILEHYISLTMYLKVYCRNFVLEIQLCCRSYNVFESLLQKFIPEIQACCRSYNVFKGLLQKSILEIKACCRSYNEIFSLFRPLVVVRSRLQPVRSGINKMKCALYVRTVTKSGEKTVGQQVSRVIITESPEQTLESLLLSMTWIALY